MGRRVDTGDGHYVNRAPLFRAHEEACNLMCRGCPRFDNSVTRFPPCSILFSRESALAVGRAGVRGCRCWFDATLGGYACWGADTVGGASSKRHVWREIKRKIVHFVALFIGVRLFPKCFVCWWSIYGTSPTMCSWAVARTRITADVVFFLTFSSTVCTALHCTVLRYCTVLCGMRRCESCLTIWRQQHRTSGASLETKRPSNIHQE